MAEAIGRVISLIKELIDEGYTVTEEIRSRLSPYATFQINRFGN